MQMTKRAWREARRIAFDKGDYIMIVPPVTTGRWDTVAWCNHVHFTDPMLRGYDDRSDRELPARESVQ